MSSPGAIQIDQASPMANWIIGLVLALILVFVSGMLTYSVINGPRVRAEAEKRIAQEIALENETVCDKLGIPAGSRDFAICAGELVQVRQRHEVRINGDGGFD
jgi:hypothetical protein